MAQDYGELGVLKIHAERQRQIQVKGWSAEHDDTHTDGSLADCAAMIAEVDSDVMPGEPWQFDRAAHVRSKYRDNRIQQLAIAGALIAAEIDRLLRVKKAEGDVEYTRAVSRLPGK